MLDVEKLIAGVHDYIGRALAPFAARVKALEDRAPVRGPQGEPGESIRGEQGAAGPAGKDGAPGAQGPAGVDGKPGRDGANGKDAAPTDTVAIAREAAALVPKPQDGLSITPDDVADLVAQAVGKALPGVVQRVLDELMPDFIAKAAEAVPRASDGRDGQDGKDGASIHPDTVAVMVREAVDKAIAALPQTLAANGKDGKDGRDGRDASSVLDIDAAVARAVALLPAPRDGKDGASVDEDAVLRAVTEKAMQRIAEIPTPKDGAPGRDADPMDEIAIAQRVMSLIPAPRDGRDAPELEAVVDAVIKQLPEIKSGIDGINGKDGSSVTVEDLRPIIEAATARWQLEFERGASETVQRFLENTPKPANGKDGADAAQLDTFDMALDGRMLKLSLTAGERVVTKAVRVPIPIYRGVFRSGSKYEESDMVTFAGAVWICMRDTATKPPSDDWKLCVAKGKDGKDSPA